MKIIICVPAGDEQSDQNLRELGCTVIHYPLDRKGLNPLADMATLSALKKIMGREKPDIVFATTIKPVIYGCLAASACGVPHIYATITGLGYAFEADTPLKKIINRISRFLYRHALARASGVFFQNHDDADLFIREGILDKSDRILFARGTGVDTEHFASAPLPDGQITFLLVGRLLEAKGIEDYAKAASLLKTRYPQARFQLLGPKESGPGRLSDTVLESSALEYLGEAADVRPYLANAHVVVLPSWREGLPTSLMEAMSMGRPIVATDVPGCREVVDNGENGFLVRLHDPDDLASAMEKFIVEPALIATMGQKGRDLAVNLYDANVVADGILNDMTGITR